MQFSATAMSSHRDHQAVVRTGTTNQALAIVPAHVPAVGEWPLGELSTLATLGGSSSAQYSQ